MVAANAQAGDGRNRIRTLDKANPSLELVSSGSRPHAGFKFALALCD
jgi:hypothetical protein